MKSTNLATLFNPMVEGVTLLTHDEACHMSHIMFVMELLYYYHWRVLFSQEGFPEIASKTEGQARMFLGLFE